MVTAMSTPKRKAHQLPPLFGEPDLVDRIFDYIVEQLPELKDRRTEVEQAVREEFARERATVRLRSPTQRQELARQVLDQFNGRNATEVARRLRISRATVFRLLKQPGGDGA